MSGKWIEIASQDGSFFRAYLTAPSQGSGPGLVLCHDVDGVTAFVRETADLLAAEGYVVMAPDLRRRTGPVLRSARALRDIEATITALRGYPTCKGGVGALGHGRGGELAVCATAEGWIACAAAYEPTGIDGLATALRRTQIPLVLHVAGSNGGLPSDVLAAAAENLEAKVHVYADVDRGFSKSSHKSASSAASDMAWSRTIGLFRRVIGPQFDLDALWEVHRGCEFVTRDADATMKTMVAEPYVNHVPTMTGGFGQADLHRFYRDHFIPNNPKDMRNIPISRTVGPNRIVNEGILCFTHDTRIDWLLPGVEPTGKYVEVPLIGIVTFRGDKLVHEHIYWDQASVLVQIGLLDPTGLPVAGIDAAKKVLNPELPANKLLPNWADDAPDDPGSQ